MKILFVQHHTGVGGATRSLLALLTTLDRNRYHPAVLFTGGDGPTAARARELGCDVYIQKGIVTYGHGNGARPTFGGFPPWRPISLLFHIYPSARRMAAFLAKHRFDLVYLNSSILMPAALGCRMQGVPTTIHVREMLYKGRFGLRRRLVRNLLEKTAAHLIVLSHASRRQFSERIPVTVIYNSVDFSEFDRRIPRQAARQALGLPENGALVVMLGGALPHKGADIFVRAADLVSRTHPYAYFAVLGYTASFVSREGPFLKRTLKRWLLPDPGQDLQTLVASLDTHERVLMPGVRDDVPTWLAAADLCVFPAREDHFARPVIEAGAMGIPAIASDGPTARELIEDGVHGRLVPAGDPVALADVLRELLLDPTTRAAMGERAYERARERYDVCSNTLRIQEVIDHVSASQ